MKDGCPYQRLYSVKELILRSCHVKAFSRYALISRFPVSLAPDCLSIRAGLHFEFLAPTSCWFARFREVQRVGRHMILGHNLNWIPTIPAYVVLHPRVVLFNRGDQHLGLDRYAG